MEDVGRVRGVVLPAQAALREISTNLAFVPRRIMATNVRGIIS